MLVLIGSCISMVYSYTCSVHNWIVRTITNNVIFMVLLVTSYVIYVTVENAEETGAREKQSIKEALSNGWNGLWNLIVSFQAMIYNYPPQ